MDEFYKSDQIKDSSTTFKQASINLKSEDLTKLDKEFFFRQATLSGQVTFLTRAFSAEALYSYVERDKTFISNGGVHVIQTFLSEDVSEEIQIQGRTA